VSERRTGASERDTTFGSHPRLRLESNRPQENACGGAKRRGASDDDRREEGFSRHPPSGFGAGGQNTKNGYFLYSRRKK